MVMDAEKRKRLEAAGWAVGDAGDFLDLNPAEAELVELKVRLALFAKEQRKTKNLSQDALANLMGSSHWQRRFWEHLIRDEQDFNHHVDYIHYNPVKHGLVLFPKDWQYSSFDRYVQRGVYDFDWGSSEILFDSLIGME
jgi:hypothetical protein